MTIVISYCTLFILQLNLKSKPNKALDENWSLSYETSPAIWDHTVLPATRHKWTRPALTPGSKLVLDLPIPEGWKAELTYATQQCTDQESNSRSFYHESDALTTTLAYSHNVM